MRSNGLPHEHDSTCSANKTLEIFSHMYAMDTTIIGVREPSSCGFTYFPSRFFLEFVPVGRVKYICHWVSGDYVKAGECWSDRYCGIQPRRLHNVSVLRKADSFHPLTESFR